MASLALGVRFNPVSAGTADFVYSGAVTGYTNPTGLTDGKTYRYRAESGDLSQWEWGSGTWTAGTTTLARTTVLLSSNSNSKVSFTTQPQVSIVIFPADVIQFDDAMSLTTAQQAQARSNINANLLIGTVTNTLASAVAMTDNANHTGPSCAQGTVGTWLAVGTVSMLDGSGAGGFSAFLSDGTTNLHTLLVSSAASGFSAAITLVGLFTSPAGNIRIMCNDGNGSPNGSIAAGSTLTVVRIG